MKRSLAALLPGLLLTLGHCTLAQAARGCTLESGTLNYEYLLPDILDVKPDLELGAPLSAPQTLPIPPSSGTKFTCKNDNSAIPIKLSFNTLYGVSHIIGPRGDRLMKTNVEGIGVSVRLGAPLVGSADNQFIPVDGVDKSYVPFEANLGDTKGNEMLLENSLLHRIQLVKIGDIPAGVHNIDTPLFTASTDDSGEFMGFRLRSRVVSNPCTIPGTSTPAAVQLKSWPKSEFTGVGHTTTPVDFFIDLTNCEADSASKTKVVIKLEGSAGSSAIYPEKGVFSLTAGDGVAKGVGIQVLAADDTPMPLDQEKEMTSLSAGTLRLGFKARYYQIDPADQVQAGDANGALRFTISYK
ncbi:fimbrial protein [Pseudomonas guariconensis]|uniref:fimbrial protein n=1 Tax=Pseudomonas guariconensis TaxID=1288410 RepID=UPI0018AB8202|nr:fimbrial protein [Pseudomonas guariconensis]MBF8722159.1 type 1 fimbrial protein [Pseudomonas guariconensis]MBF8791890.1 type 1 fimbrial protein [Pseudomonas monteilii]